MYGGGRTCGRKGGWAGFFFLLFGPTKDKFEDRSKYMNALKDAMEAWEDVLTKLEKASARSQRVFDAN